MRSVIYQPGIGKARGNKGPRTKKAVARARRLRCHDCGGPMAPGRKPSCPACGCQRVAVEDWPW